MDEFRQWALCLIIAAAAGTFVCAVSPRGTSDKAVRTVAGIFVVAAVCTPLTQLEKSGIDIPAFGSAEGISDCGESLKEYLLDSCKDAIGIRIEEIAGKHSLTVYSIKMNAYADEYNSIIIRDIQLEINSETPENISHFKSEAEEVLGVPVIIRNGIRM